MKLLEAGALKLPPLRHRLKVAERTIPTALDSIGLRMSIYYMPKGTKMPIHNHPQMMVVTYIIEGQVLANLYTATQQPEIYTKEEFLLKNQSLALIDGLRTPERNLH